MINISFDLSIASLVLLYIQQIYGDFIRYKALLNTVISHPGLLEVGN